MRRLLVVAATAAIALMLTGCSYYMEFVGTPSVTTAVAPGNLVEVDLTGTGWIDRQGDTGCPDYVRASFPGVGDTVIDLPRSSHDPHRCTLPAFKIRVRVPAGAEGSTITLGITFYKTSGTWSEYAARDDLEVPLVPAGGTPTPTPTATATPTVTPTPASGPQARFTVSANPIKNTPTHFDASTSSDADGTISNYHWDFGDGTDPIDTAAATVDHNYEVAGPATVTLTVTDNQARMATVSHDLTVAAARRRVRITRAKGFPLAITGRLVTLGKLEHTGGVFRAPDVRAAGIFTAPRAPKAVRFLRTATWAGQFSATTKSGQGDPLTMRGRGVLYAVGKSATACLRVRGDVRKGTGHFTVLGGTGKAKRLYATGRIGARARVSAHTGAPRGLPVACRALKHAPRGL